MFQMILYIYYLECLKLWEDEGASLSLIQTYTEQDFYQNCPKNNFQRNPVLPSELDCIVLFSFISLKCVTLTCQTLFNNMLVP